MILPLPLSPNWPMDAAHKLGLDPDVEAVPPPMACGLERRRATAKVVVPSTFGGGWPVQRPV